MRVKFLFSKFLILSAVLLTTSCVDISNRTLEPQETTGSATVSDSVNSGNSDDSEEEYKTYAFTEKEELFLSETVFVGDGLALGLTAYGLVGEENVIADAEINAENINGFKFENSGLDVITSLINRNPSVILIMLGNIEPVAGGESEFTDNYTEFLNKIKSYLPEARIYAASAAPVFASTDMNRKIDSLNAAVKEMADGYGNGVSFTDISAELKNADGGLKEKYAAGGGGLTETAYYAVLWSIVKGQ